MITDDIRIETLKPLVPPAILLEEVLLNYENQTFIKASRDRINAIVKGEDDRLMVIVGPCSIHDIKAAHEYASLLKPLRDKYKEDLEIIMRVYFEKPRTRSGWKGLINDPHIDNSFQINEGLRLARRLLVDLTGMGLPVGCEFLDTISPQFLADCVSWGAIGARTTESQIHRELASGLSMAVGFKNGTDGNVKIAVDAICAAGSPHRFLSITKQGVAAIVHTKGNPTAHLILRGSTQGANYDKASVEAAAKELIAAEVTPRVVIDCSHGNSKKDFTRQPIVARDVAKQVAEGSETIMGVMLESHIKEGNQKEAPLAKLEYGKSITDACISFETTAPLLDELASAVKKRRAMKKAVA
ncbi:MAG: Phospho-2-dehydro-3-deoxyheptonate aldolase, Phe-sensitive [Turneriella sp.]|nr:Phospho-2-dehydro-3-deoxyheptonate aldolase, Phe-sensitive [Turneriella sp.]